LITALRGRVALGYGATCSGRYSVFYKANEFNDDRSVITDHHAFE